MKKWCLAGKSRSEGENDDLTDVRMRASVGGRRFSEMRNSASGWYMRYYGAAAAHSFELRIGVCRTPGCGHSLGWHLTLDGECHVRGCGCGVFRVRMADLDAETRKVLEEMGDDEEA